MSKFNLFMRKVFYHWVYDPIYSIWYSVKDIGLEIIGFLQEFKKPNTWSSILYVACFYAFMTKNFTLFKWLIPSIVVVYIIRQRIDGRYRHEIYQNALLNNNNTILEEEYERYKRECHFTKQSALDYTQWKEQEQNKLKSSKSD